MEKSMCTGTCNCIRSVCVCILTGDSGAVLVENRLWLGSNRELPLPPPPLPTPPAVLPAILLVLLMRTALLMDPVDLKAGIGRTMSGLGPIASFDEDVLIGIELRLSPGGFPLIL